MNSIHAAAVAIAGALGVAAFPGPAERADAVALDSPAFEGGLSGGIRTSLSEAEVYSSAMFGDGQGSATKSVGPADDDILSVRTEGFCSAGRLGQTCSTEENGPIRCSVEGGSGSASCSTNAAGASCSSDAAGVCSIGISGTNDPQEGKCTSLGTGKCSASGDGVACSAHGGSGASCSVSGTGGGSCSTYNGSSTCSVAPGSGSTCTASGGATSGSCSAHGDMAGHCSVFGSMNPNQRTCP